MIVTQAEFVFPPIGKYLEGFMALAESREQIQTGPLYRWRPLINSYDKEGPVDSQPKMLDLSNSQPG